MGKMTVTRVLKQQYEVDENEGYPGLSRDDIRKHEESISAWESIVGFDGDLGTLDVMTVAVTFDD